MGFLNIITNTIAVNGVNGQFLRRLDFNTNNIDGAVDFNYLPIRLIGAQTANNSVSINFNDIFLTTYNMWRIVWSGVRGVTNNVNLTMQMSNNFGASWITTGYQSGAYGQAYNSTTLNNSNATTNWTLTRGINNGTGNYACGFCDLIQTPANYSYLMGTTSYRSGTGGGTTNGGWMTGIAGSTGTGAVRFQMSSGNISTGKFYIYGYIAALT